MDYKYNLWINSTIFQIHHWSMFMSPVWANNVVEGWHNRFNSNVVTHGPVPFYHLVIELYAVCWHPCSAQPGVRGQISVITINIVTKFKARYSISGNSMCTGTSLPVSCSGSVLLSMDHLPSKWTVLYDYCSILCALVILYCSLL